MKRNDFTLIIIFMSFTLLLSGCKDAKWEDYKKSYKEFNDFKKKELTDLSVHYDALVIKSKETIGGTTIDFQKKLQSKSNILCVASKVFDVSEIDSFLILRLQAGETEYGQTKCYINVRTAKSPQITDAMTMAVKNRSEAVFVLHVSSVKSNPVDGYSDSGETKLNIESELVDYVFYGTHPISPQTKSND